jgi:recombinational DNA repair protein RecR
LPDRWQWTMIAMDITQCDMYDTCFFTMFCACWSDGRRRTTIVMVQQHRHLLVMNKIQKYDNCFSV